MSVPLIGITAYPRVVDIVPGPTLLHTANRYYVDSVIRAGGLPVILPAVDPSLAGVAVGRVDGLVLPGGGDVAPELYGEEPDPTVRGVDELRDTWEIACALVALEQRRPMLATCRGLQVLNVALGGSLVQDVPTVTGERHGFADRFQELVHGIRVDPDSRLAGLVGACTIGANSLHHQAVARLGSGVRAVAWAPDGTIEAVEVDEHPEVVAVQWHPELLSDDPVHQGLFRHLVVQSS
jgi:putative glutamine amidotransferase